MLVYQAPSVPLPSKQLFFGRSMIIIKPRVHETQVHQCTLFYKKAPQDHCFARLYPKQHSVNFASPPPDMYLDLFLKKGIEDYTHLYLHNSCYAYPIDDNELIAHFDERIERHS